MSNMGTDSINNNLLHISDVVIKESGSQPGGSKLYQSFHEMITSTEGRIHTANCWIIIPLQAS